MERNSQRPQLPTLKDIRGIAGDLGVVGKEGYTNKTLLFTEAQRQMFCKVTRLAQEISESVFPLPHNCPHQFKELRDIATKLPRTLTGEQKKHKASLATVTSVRNYIDRVYREAGRIQEDLDSHFRATLKALPASSLSPNPNP